MEVYGKVNFPLSSSVGQSYAPILRPMVTRAYHGHGAKRLTTSLRLCLETTKQVIKELEPVRLKNYRNGPLIYTDASFRRRW
jgi:hypothetical protein